MHHFGVAARVCLAVALLAFAACDAQAQVVSGQTSVVIPKAGTWKYWDSTPFTNAACVHAVDVTPTPRSRCDLAARLGCCCPHRWILPSFVDTPWKSGIAPLGYGFPNLFTTISLTPRRITSYFRRDFTANTTFPGFFRLSLFTDDGAVVVSG
jgi:hypothetical protein